LAYLLSIFANNILPILLAAGAGYLVSKYTDIQPRSISLLAFKIFIPCLLFELLTTSQLSNDDILRMGGFTLVSIGLLGIVSWLIFRIIGFQRRMLSALLLVTIFGNAGNYGLSLNKFAFGETALAYASVYFSISIILINTLGLIIANLGTTNLRKGLLELLKTPAVYALGFAVFFNLTGWKLPMPIDRTVSALSDAAIPTMLVLMGVQLFHSPRIAQQGTLLLASGVKLLLSPLVALPIALLFGLKGPAFQAGISEAAMPTAVLMAVVATEYDSEPAFVTLAVVLSSLLSPLTLTPILALLGA
jgi:predicted permease